MVWTDFGHAGASALAEAVERAQGDDPLAPVHVATPNRYAALSARRALAARPRGLANVRCEPLPRIAELLAAPDLIGAGRRPLRSARWTNAIRHALPGGHPAAPAVRAYDRAFADLRTATDAHLRAMAAADAQAATTIEAFRAARASVADAFDTEDALHAAAILVRTDAAARATLGTVVVWLPAGATPAELALLTALHEQGRLSCVFGLTGDAEADAPVVALAAELGAPAPPDGAPRPMPAHVTLRRAPDPEEEVRAALRSVLASADTGVPLHEHAILVRDLDPYGRIIHEQAAAAGIPIAGPEARTLRDTMLGRFLTTVLGLDAATMHRDEYVAWLTSAPLLDPGTGERAHTTRWDVLTRSAGLIADGATFLPALDAFITQRRADLASTPAEDATAGKRRAIGRDLDDTTALRAFTATFLTAVDAPERQSWSAWVAWCRSLVATYLGPETRRRNWPDADAEAAQRIDALLDTLTELGAESIARSTFAETLTLELDGPGEAIGRFGTGVFVGRVTDAIGTTFANVTILGVTDGRFPAARRDDALLPDRARRAGGLVTRTQRRAHDRYAFLAAVAAGRTTTCSFPVADPRRQRVALPSRWLVQWAAERAGTHIGAEALRTMAPTEWLDVIVSFAASITAEPALHRADAELGALLAGAAPADPALDRALAAARARRADALTPHEGDVGTDLPILTGVSVSPTSLERWARCPRSFFFEKVLGLTDVQRPEALDSIRPDERGSLVHVVLDRFISEARPRTGPTDAWDATDRALLDAIFDAECAQRAADGRTGRPVRWLVEQRRLRRRLHTFLDHDTALRASLGVIPALTEFAFGTDGAPDDAVQLPGLPALHGIADRIDTSPDGTLAAVYDYKTGAPGPFRKITADDPTVHGTRLQLPTYALAARERTGADRVRAAYWFIGEDATPQLVPLELTPEVMTAFASAVTAITDGITAGLFPAVPGPRTLGGHANCTVCPFDSVCPADRARTWEHVRQDPRLASYRALAEPEAPA